MSEQRFLYFAKRPPLEELEVVTLLYRALNNTVPLLQMKCRELARADANCIIAPVPSTNDNTAWAIAKIGYFTECTTHQKLSQLGFEITSRSQVTAETLQRCLQFTVMARMAPKWNRIGPHLVQGCEFFCSGKTCYVGFEVSITSTEILLALEAGQIKFTFLKPEDLTTTPSLLQQYKCDAKGMITETSIENRRCTVYSVSTTIPLSREFATYNSIRMHWKKHHGFVLPDRQNTFYQIYFAFRPSQLLSYPGCCVLQYPPVTYKCKDSAAICAAFLDCLHSRLPTLCGRPINYTTRLLQPDVGLSTALHSRTFINLLHVGRKPASVGTTCTGADCSSTVDNSDNTVKPNHPYIPIFHSSSMSGKVSNERLPPANLSLAQQYSSASPHKLFSSASTSSNETARQGDASNDSQVRSSSTRSIPNKIAPNSSLHKGNSSSDDMMTSHDNTSLIAQIIKQKVTTLKKWLVMNDIKFKASSKKDDLVKLIAAHIKDVRQLHILSSEE